MTARIQAGSGSAGSSGNGEESDLGNDVFNPPADEDWLAGAGDEDVLDPDLPIVDSHNHMWDKPGSRYMHPELLADIEASGHNIVANVYIEDCLRFRSSGPEMLRPVGETEFMAGISESWPAGRKAARINTVLIGYADLLLGAAVAPVLEAHVSAGRGRFRGIRQFTRWAPQASMRGRPSGPRSPVFQQMMSDMRFREGFACLAPLNLSFDAWLYHAQLPELVDLANAFPDTRIIVDHMGGLARVGPYRGKEDEAFAEWASSISRLARHPMVSIKLGGMGMRLFGFDFRERRSPPSSVELSELWRPYVDHCIEAFGAERCMFESNFPVDRANFTYRAVWNAFKRLASGASADERHRLFALTAARVYGFEVPGRG